MDNPIDRLFREFDKGLLSRRELFRAGRGGVRRSRGVIRPGRRHDGWSWARPRQSRAGRHDALACTVRPDRLEDRLARSPHIPVHRLSEGRPLLRRGHGMEGARRRRQAMRDGHRRRRRRRGIHDNGYVPPPLRRRHRPPADTGGGRGGGGGGGARPAAHGAISNFAWGIDPWDTNKVEAELKKRGLNPVADHAGDFKSFHVKDPDGFDIQVTNGTNANRRKGAANGKFPGPMPFEPTGWKTMWVDHLSYGCTDFKRTFAFYEALLGWSVRRVQRHPVTVDMGDAGGAIIRNRAGGEASTTSRSASKGSSPTRSRRS